MTPWHLRRAAEMLRAGGVVAHPTEGVMGLACDPLNSAAVMHLLRLKQRDISKGLILIADHYERLNPYLAPLAEWMDRRVLASWPGPVTWILPAAKGLPVWLTGGRDSLAVRVTAHPVASRLCQTFGDALVSTSANRSGRPPALNVTAVRARLGDAVDYCLAGALQTPRRPSEIRDGYSGELLRPR